MTTHQDTDKDLRCATCGDGFVFSAGEQQLYRLRGLTEPPLHCPRCARRGAQPIAHMPTARMSQPAD